MKRILADLVLFILRPIIDWCYANCTWIPMEELFAELDIDPWQEVETEDAPEAYKQDCDCPFCAPEGGVVGDD